MIHKRRRPRRGRVVDKPYLAWMATQRCCITGEWPATTHHVRFCGSQKDDRRTIRLVDRLHMLTHAKPGVPCVEQGKDHFESFHGVDIEAEIAKANARYVEFLATGMVYFDRAA